MKKFKKLIGIGIAGLIATTTPIFITAFTVTAPVAVTGCGALAGGGGTGTNSQAQIDATALILQNAARAGCSVAISPQTGDTNNAAYFQLASQALGLFVTGKDYSPAAFQKALMDVKVPQANNVWVQLGLATVIDLYQVYFSQYVTGQVNGNMAAGTFILAVQNGFNQALGNPVAAVATPDKLQFRTAQSLRQTILPRPLNK